MGLLTVKEVADRLKLTPYTVREWIREGKLKASKVGGVWRIKEDNLSALLEESGGKAAC
ncbi:helix-turn-helix domain-containing protein [Acetanaerobacterium elongatum]|uniref:DNA binding domain-containing protein, excisionase family n=1 Tax=Acetanaerobacterium elongatum TaxID=258515 RepID=A0A1G9Z015_9FIRM|nr:helix-turn-helix domain-containing protein [Acetanaerobacterium elongatum]SDN14073.1 DNA binding domain-containing protein, excisionase family [Acetanaerobacterium elongatum]